jgi:DNA-binding transcriptional ArsR family regulator
LISVAVSTSAEFWLCITVAVSRWVALRVGLQANADHRGVLHDLAPGTVSEHLTVLRDTGLVTGQRHRHEIRYQRTAMGTALVRGW